MFNNQTNKQFICQQAQKQQPLSKKKSRIYSRSAKKCNKNNLIKFDEYQYPMTPAMSNQPQIQSQTHLNRHQRYFIRRAQTDPIKQKTQYNSLQFKRSENISSLNKTLNCIGFNNAKLKTMQIQKISIQINSILFTSFQNAQKQRKHFQKHLIYRRVLLKPKCLKLNQPLRRFI